MGLEKYMDIIDHEHHVSVRHQRMPAMDRAAQFAPFAALTGYEAVIAETGRQTQERMDLDDMQILHLNEAMAIIQENIAARPRICLTYFIQDPRKKGGSYATVEECVRNIDMSDGTMVLSDGTSVKLSDVHDIQIIKQEKDYGIPL